MTLGKLLKQARLKRGLTVSAVASQIDISHSYLTLIENDRRYLPKQLVRKLSGILGLPTETIYQAYVDQELFRAGVDPTEHTDTKFRNIFDGLNDAVAEMDAVGRITEVNKRLEEMFGWERDEIVGKPFWKIGFIIPRDLSELIDGFKQFIFHRRVYDYVEFSAKTKNGDVLRLEVSSKLFRRNHHWYVLAVVRDMTNRKQSARSIRAQKIHWELQKKSKP